MLKISLALILLAVIPSASVYAETISVSVDGDLFDIKYRATGVTVSDVEADLSFVSLTFTVDVPDSDGTLDLTFDRSFFDSDDFLVMVDDDDTPFTETDTTPQSKTLSIKLPAGTESVEIIGSAFGTETPKDDLKETPKDDPKETPKDDPKETPKETPKEATTSSDDVQKNKCGLGTILKDGSCVLEQKCGPGTILKDGSCVLDERCGPGTILKDEKCVLDSTSKPSAVKTSGKDLVVGTAAGFVISAIIGIILGIFAWAHKVRN